MTKCDFIYPFFMSPMAALLGSVFFFLGLLTMRHGLRPGRECLGAIGGIPFVIGGFLLIVWLLYHSENASASPGFYSVSASCYGRIPKEPKP